MTELAMSAPYLMRQGLSVPSSGSSSDSDSLVRLLLEAANHMSWPTRNTKSLRTELLEQLAEQWRSDTQFFSSVSDMVAHSAYQRIIGMGLDALPFLLKRLEAEPQHWFPALEAIAGVNPVRVEDTGRVKKMAEAWVAWGKEQGHI
jgi:hypothetical protein